MRDNFIKKQKRKEFIVVLLVCMVCLSAIIVGTASFTKGRNKAKEDSTEKLVDLNEEAETDKVAAGDVIEPTGKTNDDNSNNNTSSNNSSSNLDEDEEQDSSSKPSKTESEDSSSRSTEANNQDSSIPTMSQNTKDSNEELESENNDISENSNLESVNNAVSSLSFGAEDALAWPVSGNVILDFNMDNTIYFPTLDTYKCNPAIVIQSDSGIDVTAAASGYVETVGANDEIGNYVVTNIGSGYKITYGQLKDICVNEGQVVEASAKLGSVNEPTKYYSKEGYNVFFEMTLNDEPVDPLDFLK